jgi:hypothetical protein
VLGHELNAIREDGTLLSENAFPWTLSLRTGKNARAIVGIADPAGAERRWFIVSASPDYREGEHSPHQVSVVFSDITDLITPGGRIQAGHPNVPD